MPAFGSSAKRLQGDVEGSAAKKRRKGEPLRERDKHLLRLLREDVAPLQQRAPLGGVAAAPLEGGARGAAVERTRAQAAERAIRAARRGGQLVDA